jgi:hypothetical protein
MTCLVLLGLTLTPPQNLEGWLTRGLAVIGAAAVGAIGAGLLVQVLVKLLTTQTVPRPILRLIRVVGAITAGWLVVWLLFQPGGGGGGSGGGQGPNTGDKSGDGGKTPPDKDAPAKDKASEGVPKDAEIKVEVVGNVQDPEKRFYRFQGQKQRRTLEEMRESLRERLKQGPPVDKVVLVLYEIGSPAADHRNVTQLEEELKSLKLPPDISKPSGPAPP